MSRLALALPFVFAIALTGCGGPLVEAGQPSTGKGVLRLTATSSVGQSFMAYQGGLQGIEFRLARGAGERPSGVISFQLRSGAASPEVLAEGSIDASQASGSALRVDFPPQSAERLRDYFISLQFAGSGGFDLLAGPPDSYLNGAAYQDGQPLEAQLAFRLFHDPLRAGIGLAELLGRWVALGGAATVMLILPGLALLLLLPAASRTGAGRLDLLFLAPALSIGVYPLLNVLTGLLGLRLGPMYAWLSRRFWPRPPSPCASGERGRRCLHGSGSCEGHDPNSWR